ncbi:hypothetical protein [Streptacidiphilus monticola]|jgi:hypothetical protein|uniref:Uncharacterized protein n=1 Tax=Streptacidiphilus monticola TaxID=2161674 RepID=A0ABW1G849_9ACTN
MNRPLRLLLAAAVLLPLAGCASATAAPAAVTPCTALPPSGLPDSAGSLTEANSGTFCLPLGGRVDVFLTAHPTGDRWQRPDDSAPSVLRGTTSGIMTPPVGVTVALYTAAAPGTAVLSSDAPSGRHWQVTLVVRRR